MCTRTWVPLTPETWRGLIPVPPFQGLHKRMLPLSLTVLAPESCIYASLLKC